jgi:hypothetical protein
MHSTRLSVLAVLLFLSIWFSISLSAQQATAFVVITVADPSGAGIPHASVRVIPAPDPAAKLETNDKGQLALDLKLGGYALFVQSQGFKALINHFEVRAAKEVQTVRVVLQVGAVSGPTVSPATSKDDLALFAYPYHEPTALSPSQFKTLPHITVTFHNSHTNADETYSGVRVADLLTPLGAPLGSELHGVALTSYLVATGADGYEAVLALAEVDPGFHPGEVIVADAMNGKPLDEHAGPFKLVVTEDKRPARSVRNLVSLDLRLLQ